MKKYHQLSQEERYTISGNLRNYPSQAELARAMGRSPSTISREIRRNQRHNTNSYTAIVAQSYATARRRRQRRGSQFTDGQWAVVISMLKQHYSPEQIANRLKFNHDFSISHETIYRYILRDKKSHGTLYKYLRHIPKRRRKRYGTKDSRGRLDGKRKIETRPEVIETRTEYGHWEWDTVVGSDRHHCLLTLVERMTGMAIIKKLKARTNLEVTRAMLEILVERGAEFKTITFDNGTEFHGYEVLEAVYPLKTYFATPYHSWERGSNENLNGLIRQYIPKGTCMDYVTQTMCTTIAAELNQRPRKRFGYRTPQEVYNATVL